MTIKITPNDHGNPAGKLADAEIHFTDGPLEGLKLIGFSVWEAKRGGRRNVTSPERQYNVNGERRSFALLRPIVDASAQCKVVSSSSMHTRNAKRRPPSRVSAESRSAQLVGRSVLKRHPGRRAATLTAHWLRKFCRSPTDVSPKNDGSRN
jgi:hypothetical protein